MSTSRAIKPKRDDTVLSNWQSVPERAPSVERDEAPTAARIIAMVGLFLFVLGVLAMTAPLWRVTGTVIQPVWGLVLATFGGSLIVYHTFVERDFQFRRLYGFLGLAIMIGGGVVLRALAFKAGFTEVFMLYGVPCLAIGLVILIAVIRNESDASFRTLLLNTIGVVGALMVGFAAMRGLMNGEYMAGEGVVLLLLGLLFACAYIGMQNSVAPRSEYVPQAAPAPSNSSSAGSPGFSFARVGMLFLIFCVGSAGLNVGWRLARGGGVSDGGTGISIGVLVLGIFVVGFWWMIRNTSSPRESDSPFSANSANDDRGYYVALAIGALGLLGIVATIFRCAIGSTSFFVPGGLILTGMSILYIAISIGICCDWAVVILTRRDLVAYFYSPVGYLVFIGLAFVGGFMFLMFVEGIVNQDPRDPMFEPIVGRYIFSIIPVIVQMFVVPVITMRLLSEEKRSGTLEVLMTAPVSEVSVVLGKFFACWIFYMLTWLPWWMYLVSLRYFGQESFDFLPVLAFTLAVGAISAGLLSMGLFFSSMTSNQIIAAVLTFVGVMMHLVIYFLGHGGFLRNWPSLVEGLNFVNFFDLWQTSLGGMIAPRYLLFHLSVTVFFLFGTVKMLESRKWK